MKIYTSIIDISQPALKRFWVAPHSDFKIGVKIAKSGVPAENEFTVAAGSTELVADNDKVNGFTVFTISSGDEGFVEYTVTVDGVAEKFKILQIVTDSTVYEVDERGGDMSPYATKNWVEAEISSFVAEDDLSDYAKAEDLTAYATTDSLTAYVENTDLTAYYTKSETSSAAEISAAIAGAGGGAISAFDLSESPVWSKTMVENAIANNICLPQTVVQYNDNSISVLDVSGELNITAPKEVKKLLIGTNCTSYRDFTYFQYAPRKTVIPSTVSAVADEAWLNGLRNSSPIIIPDTVVSMHTIRYSDSAFPYMDFGNTRTSMPTITAPTIIPGSGRKYYVPDALYDTLIATAPWSSITSMVYRHSELEAPYLYSSKVTGGAETGTTGTPAAVNAVKSVYETDWAALSATADANTFYVVLPDPE